MKKRLFVAAAIIAVVSLFVLSSCEWKKKEETYSVTFVFDNGQAPVVSSVKKGTVISLPPDPIKGGYVFSAWYLNENFSEKFYAGTKAESDMTLYAGYVKIYTITGNIYDYYSGAQADAVGKINGLGVYTSGARAALSVEVYEGYVFASWYADGVIYSGSSNILVEVKGDTVYDVKVKKGLYLRAGYGGGPVGGTITINGQEREKIVIDGEEYFSFTGLSGDKVTIAATLDRGYTFDGWYYPNGTLFSTALSTEIDLFGDNVALYARYSYVEYGVTVSVSDALTGTAWISPDKVSYHIDEIITLHASPSVSYIVEGVYLRIDGVYEFISSSAATAITIEELVIITDGDLNFLFRADFIYADSSPDHYAYTVLPGSKVRITGINIPFVSGNVFVPAYIADMPVTSISASAFAGQSTVTKLSLPVTLTAFSGAVNPFLSCENLTAITVSPENTAFSSDNGILYDKNKTKLICYPRAKADTEFVVPGTVSRIEISAFESQKYLTKLSSGGVSYIASFAFRNALLLEEIVITSAPSSFAVESFAFIDCKNLTKVDVLLAALPSGASAVMSWAFSGCKKLSDVTLSGVKTLNEEIFSGCTALTSFNLSASVRTLTGDVFGASEIAALSADTVSVYFKGVDGVLYDKLNGKLIRCPEKKSGVVYADSSATAVAEYAFKNCTAVTAVYLQNGVSEISTGAFYNAAALDTFYMGSGVTYIADYAFYGCTALAALSLSDGVVGIGEFAFGYCEGLISIYLGTSLVETKSSSFYNCSSLISISFPSTISEIGDKYNGLDGELAVFLNCSSLTEILVAPGAARYSSKDGILYKGDDLDKSELIIRCPEAKTGVVWVTAPELAKIANYAFYQSSVTNVNFNFSFEVGINIKIETIGNQAFAYSKNLISIAMPFKIKLIGDEAFYNCAVLASVTLSANLTTIGNYAFAGCAFSEITITESVSKIYAFAFMDNPKLKVVKLLPLTAPSVATWGNTGWLIDNGKGYLFDGHNADFNIYVRKNTGGSSNISSYTSRAGWSEYKTYFHDLIE
ncbi:MAG: leucine-rich repeat protein [Clostridiales bacterium]|jgi:hypothetical protein|nr:leucine-rich repeat protein [Clostridiales bacterium]